MVKCFECKENYTLFRDKCVVDCSNYPDLIFDEKTEKCVNCSDIGKYLDPVNHVCVYEIPLGYYALVSDSRLTKCPYNCKKIFSSEAEEFCERKDIKHNCYFSLEIDEDLIICSDILRDNQAILDKYKSMESAKQNELLEEIYKNSTTQIQDNIIDGFHEIILLNQLLKVTTDKDSISKYHNENIENLIKEVDCDKIKRIYRENQNETMLLPSLGIYFSISKKERYFNEAHLSYIQKITECQVLEAIDNLKKVTAEVQKDFSLTSASTVNKLVTILDNINQTDPNLDVSLFDRNVSYRYYKAIMNSEISVKTKNLVELVFTTITTEKEPSELRYSNLEFIAIPLENILKNNFMNKQLFITFSSCEDKGKLKAQLSLLNFKTKICIPYKDLKDSFVEAKFIYLINYKSYPLLNRNTTKEISKEFQSITIRNKKKEEIQIKGLPSPIKMIIKKSDNKFSNCIFYEDKVNRLDSSHCTSEELNKDYIICSCTHLTDFSLSEYDPVKLFKDIISLFSQARIIKSFEAFSLLNAKNALVLYVISGILFCYIAIGAMTLFKDLRFGGDFFVMEVKKLEKCCEDNSKEEELEELFDTILCCFPQESIKEDLNKNGVEIEMQSYDSSAISKKSSKGHLKMIDKELEKDNKRAKKILKKSCCNTIKFNFILLKEFFRKDYWICTFFNSEKEMTKTNALTIFVVHLIASLSVCSLFAECGIEEEIDESSFNNRDLAVSIATILILEIPFTVFEVLLCKAKIDLSYSHQRNKYRANAIFRYVTVYVIFIGIVVFSIINTTWISLDSERNNLGCHFIKDFFLSAFFDCFIFQIIILLMKMIIYFILLNKSKSSCLRTSLFCLVSSLPWIFNL